MKKDKSREGTIPIQETIEYKEALNIINKSLWSDIFLEFLESEAYKSVDINNKILTYAKWLSENYNTPTKK